jgi:hypothetical protein
VPSDRIAQEKRQLEAELGAHIMTYRREASAAMDGLAQVIAPAALTEEQVARIRSAERVAGECLMVAYARPLKVTRASRARRQNPRERSGP